jgi:prepilin-type N-terminal cleavage/methylation domain-containing protein
MNPTLRRWSKSGFTLVEVMCAALLLGAVIVMAMSSFSYVTQSEAVESAQGDLELDARRLVERLRRDLWRTSRDEIVLHPPGEGPYTAISFPVLFAQMETNSVPRNADGTIRWDATVIYHLWEGDPPEVRRTVFSPRLTLDPNARAVQLADTVTQGSGASTHNGINARTQRMISNLVDWRLNTSGPRFDGYAATPGRRQANLGATVLTDGDHDFTLRVIGRNSRSSGHRVGIDWLSVSPSGSPREAEAQYVVSASGASPLLVLNTDGLWSGNYYLLFDGGMDSEFTLRMENDRWEERNFRVTGAWMDDNLEDFFDTSVTPHTFGLRLKGNDMTWEADAYTLGDVGAEPNAPVEGSTEDPGYTVRAILRGSTDPLGGFIKFNGTNAWARFRNETGHPLRLTDLYIADAEDEAGTRQPLLFQGVNALAVDASDVGEKETDMLPFPIDKTRNYVVSFRAASFSVDDSGADGGEDAGDGTAPSMPADALNTIFQSIRVSYPPEGTYRSRIIDTRQLFPEYRSLRWTASTPESSAVELRLRTGAQPDLSDAPDWDAAATPSNDGQLHLNGRYAQIQARLRPGGTNATTTAVMRDFILRWEAAPRSVDLGGVFAIGPNHGIVEVLVDGKPLIQAVTVDLEVYKEISLMGGRRRRFTASAFSEIVPRNTRSLLGEDL